VNQCAKSFALNSVFVWKAASVYPKLSFYQNISLPKYCFAKVSLCQSLVLPQFYFAKVLFCQDMVMPNVYRTFPGADACID